MNNLDIFCFTSAARTKNFSITARELKISQQAVSKHIKNLEDELGYPLFFRDFTPIELTQAGKYMAEYFSVRSSLSEMIRKEFDPEDQNKSLQIGFSQWIGATGWILEVIKSFQKSMPGIKTHLTDLNAEETYKTVSEKSLDILFTSRYSSSYIPSSWKKTKIFDQSLYLIRCSSKKPAGNYSDYPFFASYAGEDHENAVKNRVMRTCSRIGFTPRLITVCQDMGSVLLNVLLGNGLTFGSYLQPRCSSVEYCFEKTDLTVDIMLCFPFADAKPAVHSFVSFFNEYLMQSKEDKNE